MDLPPPSLSVQGVLMQYSEMDADSVTEHTRIANRSLSAPVRESDQENSVSSSTERTATSPPTIIHEDTEKQSREPASEPASEPAEPEDEDLSLLLYKTLVFDNSVDRAKHIQDLLSKGADNSYSDAVCLFIVSEFF